MATPQKSSKKFGKASGKAAKVIKKAVKTRDIEAKLAEYERELRGQMMPRTREVATELQLA